MAGKLVPVDHSLIAHAQKEAEKREAIESIKPCPCCGSEDIEIEETQCSECTSGFYIECCNCGLRTAAWIRPLISVAAWNKRPDTWGRLPKITDYMNEEDE